MSTQVYTSPTPAVNTQPIPPDLRRDLRAAGCRLYTYTDGAIGLERPCPHCGFVCYIDCNDATELHDAIPWYTAPDFACRSCRDRQAAEATQRARATGPNLLTQPPIHHGSRLTDHGSGVTHRGSRPRRRRQTVDRQARQQSRINAAFLDYNNAVDFLAAIETGVIKANAPAISHAKNVQAAALRTLRQLGAIQ